MENFSSVKKFNNKDIGSSASNVYPEDKNIYPKNGKGRVGKEGIDKNYTLPEIIEIAFKMRIKPNIIVKTGNNGKWYLKKFTNKEIQNKIRSGNSTLWVIEWNE